MRIGEHDLDNEVFVVAEIGANHEGDFEQAVLLIKKAAEAGANAVKFQTYLPERIVAASEKERIQHFRRLALKEGDFPRLAAVAREEGVLFLSTPFYLEAIDLLETLVPAFKIASGDITFVQLLEYAARKNKPVLLSTGMSTTEEIGAAIKVVEKANQRLIQEGELLLLHCVGAYPVRPEEANLRSIPFLRETFKLPVGYSDHTLGIDACLYAVALGACLIEKHFTLDKTRSSFRDHQLSADPGDMKQLVQKIRLLEKVLGDFEKKPMPGEIGNRTAMRRSLVATREIRQGEVITEEALSALRPEKGIPASLLMAVVGKKAQKKIAEGESLYPQDVTGL